jgi:hypothetical protein
MRKKICERPERILRATPPGIPAMARKSKGPVRHTGQTDAGHTRDVKVERIGPVTIYKRGSSYSLYDREAGVVVA